MPLSDELFARKLARGGRGYVPVAGSFPVFVDFTVMAPENPLSVSGTWTNNSQGTGGNGVMGTLSSLRVALATDGSTMIAQNRATGTSGFEDSFAFVPGLGLSNQRVTATLYRHPGYNPTDSHEVEIILGCAINGADNHEWIECQLRKTGGCDILRLSGASDGFTSIGTDLGAIGTPATGDVFKAEWDRGAGTVKMWLNGVLACQTSSIPSAGTLGTGAGLATFMRVTDAVATSFGFKDVLIETF